MPMTKCNHCGTAVHISERNAEAGAEVYCSQACAEAKSSEPGDTIPPRPADAPARLRESQLAKFTPGEWFLEESDGTIRSRAFAESDQMADYKGVIVCDLAPALGAWPCEGRKHAEPETRNNARLIVNAKRLLGALNAMLIHFAPPDRKTWASEEQYRAFKTACQVAAEAEGFPLNATDGE